MSTNNGRETDMNSYVVLVNGQEVDQCHNLATARLMAAKHTGNVRVVNRRIEPVAMTASDFKNDVNYTALDAFVAKYLPRTSAAIKATINMQEAIKTHRDCDQFPAVKG